MKKTVLITCFISFFLFHCGPDCLPCPDDSGNLNIPSEHWEIIKCAGSEWPEYVRNHVYCAYFQDEVIQDGKSYGGLADLNCHDIYIRNYENIYSQYRTIIHETAHLEAQNDDEDYTLLKEEEFKDAVIENSCYNFEQTSLNHNPVWE